MFLHGILDEGRRGADPPVVQVHEGAVDREGPLDFGPEPLVHGGLLGRASVTRQVFQEKRGLPPEQCWM